MTAASALRAIRGRAALAVAAACCLLAIAARGAETADVVGATHIAGRYSFGSQDFLNEGADRLLAMGTRVVKVWLSFDPKIQYPFNSAWGKKTHTLVATAKKPYFRQLFAKPFTTFVVVANGGSSSFQDGFTPEEVREERGRMFDLASYLLTTYAGTGKTFILQNWEGDHVLRTGLAEGEAPSAERVQGMIDWLNARQQGVEDARRLTTARDVTVAHAAEVNLLAAAMLGKVTVTNDVLPRIRPDLVSYSSWDLRFDPAALVRALDYLGARAAPSALYGSRNVYLGEFGVSQEQLPPGTDQAVVIRDLTEAALGWGVRYALYWQLYSNERLREYTGRPGNADLRSLWLIRADGSKTPMWNAFAAQMPTGLVRASLLDARGRAVRASDVTRGESGALSAYGRRRDRWTTFTLHGPSGPALRDGDVVSIQVHNGRYWERSAGAGLVARPTRPDAGGGFILHRLAGAGELVTGDAITLESRRTGLFVHTDASTSVDLGTTPSSFTLIFEPR